MSEAVIRIDERFRGPPDSGNGGYVCGRVARFVQGPAAVRLLAPPPLEADLRVRPTPEQPGGVEVYDVDSVVARGRPARVEAEIPEPPTPEEAEAASRRYRGFDLHWFPTCFVCGPEREEADGLRIFAGPVDGRDLVAAAWVPAESLNDGTGRVSPEFVWAALDCPGAFSFPPGEKAAVLGELAVDVRGHVAVGERCVVVAREVGHDGRKHFTESVLYGESGGCRAVGLGTWIEIA